MFTWICPFFDCMFVGKNMSKKDETLSSLYQKFIEFEEKNKLFMHKIDNAFIWELIRFRIFKALMEDKLHHSNVISSDTSSVSTQHYFQRLWKYTKSIFQIRRNPFFTNKKDIVILNSPRRKLKENGKWWDIYTDYFIEEMRFSSVSIEEDYLSKHFKPAQTKNLKYFSFLDFVLFLKRIFRLNRTYFSEKDEKLLNDLRKQLGEKFSLKFPVKKLVKELLLYRKRVLPLYSKLLKRINPKVAIVICSYGKEFFIEQCKTMQIPVIELQHGIINQFHTGYTFEKGFTKVNFPDFLFTFGDFWNKVAHYPINVSNVISVGYPELELNKKKYPIEENANRLLFISQKPIGPALSKLAVEIQEESADKYEIIYKLHPNEYSTWRDDYPWLVNSEICVIDSSEKELYELYSQSSFLIGVYSTAVIEGLSFGLRTFVLDVPGIENLNNFIEHGYIEVVQDANDLLKLLHQERTRNDVSEDIFKENSIQNIISEIENIIYKDRIE